jgi:hypothetical protein
MRLSQYLQRRRPNWDVTGFIVYRVYLNPDSAVQLKRMGARCDPGAAKASDPAVLKSFWALARRCDQAQYPLAAAPIDVCSEAQPHRLAAQGLRLALPVDRNCGIRVE